MSTLPKKQKLDCADINNGTSISDTELQNSIEQLDIFQQELDKIQDKITEEVFKIEVKYAPEKRILYKKRNEAIRNISNFWRLTLSNHPDLANIIDKNSDDILSYVTELDVVSHEFNDKTFRIIFYFKENPYFFNECISKEYRVENKDDKTDLIITPTAILWRENKEIPLSSKPCKTLIGWMQTYEDKDLHVAECIRDDIYTNPLQYYLLKDGDNDGEDNSDEVDEDEEMDDVLIVETDDDEDNNILDNEDNSSDISGTDELVIESSCNRELPVSQENDGQHGNNDKK